MIGEFEVVEAGEESFAYWYLCEFFFASSILEGLEDRSI